MTNGDFPWFFVCLPGRVDPTAKLTSKLRAVGPGRSLVGTEKMEQVHPLSIVIYIYGQGGKDGNIVFFYFWGGTIYIYMAVCQNLVPLVNIKKAGK